ncbi:MAG TPA: VWA domain-containing protein, partial [Planctomycetota bacterium]|nr:VWA domain-containing protein [Planctomycetota bacterium]
MTKTSFLGFGWLRPELAPWAIIGGVVFLLGFYAVQRRALAIDTLVAPRQRGKFVPRLSLNRARARFVLAALAVVFLSCAAAGPVRGFTLREIRRRGLDLVVCVDTSRSMLVRDLRPDRITRARREVNGLIERMRGDRMALIAFAGDAREVAPLTHDRSALASLLTNMTPAENEKGGTDLAVALERALAMFDGRTGAHEGIVLLTDGEDLEGRGLEAAKKAAQRGVKVFVVGMGTEAGGKIPIERPGGGEAFLRGPDGQEVVSAMSGRGLEELASTTGGAYLSADASAAPLEELYEKRISRLEAREVQGGQEFVPHDRFQWFLGLAGACMLGAAGLRERRARAPKRRATRARS